MDLDRRDFLKQSLKWGTGGLLASTLVSSSLLTSNLLGAPSSATSQYTVKRGDTLSGIASKFKVTVQDLKRVNELDGDRILVGQVLLIPTEPSTPTLISHKVQRGDTLSGLALKYGTTVSAIKALNELNSDTIHVGQILKIESTTSGPVTYRYIQEVVDLSSRLSIPKGRWQWIVGHHSGIRHGNATTYDRSHRRRGMTNGLAYHFVIGNGVNSGDGQVEIGNRWKEQLQGGHVRSHRVNMAGIGICMVGNFEESRPTTRQMEAFVELVSYLKNDLLAGQTVKFSVHKEIEPNLCPGKNFPVQAMHRLFG